MTSFFDKLKKGMDIENSKQNLPEEATPVFVSNPTSKKKPTEKKAKKKAKMKKIKVEKEKPNKEKLEVPKEKKWFKSEGKLTIDLYQTNEEIIIQSAIAGIRPEDLDISIENDLVLIKGNRVKPFEKNQKNYFYQECYWGPFSREIILPDEVDPSRIRALMKQGILTIRIPKIERKKKRKVAVKE